MEDLIEFKLAEYWDSDYNTDDKVVEIYINGREIVQILKEIEEPYAIEEGHQNLAGAYGHNFPDALYESLSEACISESYCNKYGAELLCCDGCGDSGCWSVLVFIKQDENYVYWYKFKHNHRDWKYNLAFKFKKEQYEMAMLELKKFTKKLTAVYFVRHAEPNYNNHDDMSRELSPKGLEDRKLVTKFLSDKQVDLVLSSPFKRAVDTVRDFAEVTGLEIGIVEDFRERKIDSVWIEDFHGFCKAQWADFNYKLSDGECLGEVQERNVAALNKVLEEHAGKTIVVGSHGTALSTIINYYDKSFGHAEFEKIRGLMPWVVEFRFDGLECVGIKQYDLFTGDSL